MEKYVCSNSSKLIKDFANILNSTFTCHLISILINTLTIKTFTAYGILSELISPADFSAVECLQNGSWLVIMLGLEAAIVFMGNEVTQAAKEAGEILTKVLNHSTSNNEANILMQNFVTRLNGKNFDVRNCFIKINSSLLVHVRVFFLKIRNYLSVSLISVNSNNCHLLGHHLSV